MIQVTESAKNMGNILLKFGWYAFPVIAYVLVTVILFHERIALIHTHYGLPDVDTDGTFWYYWARIFSDIKGINFELNNSFIAYPFGYDFTHIPYFSLIYELHILIIKYLGLSFPNIISVANISTLLTYPLAATSAYFLAYYLTKDKISSFFAGILYGFSYYHLYMIGGSLSLNHIELIPLAFLGVFAYIDKQNYFRLIISIIIVTITFYANAYWGFFAAILFLPLFGLKVYFGNITIKKVLYYYIFLVAVIVLSNTYYFYTQLYTFGIQTTDYEVQLKASVANNELLNAAYYFLPDADSKVYRWGRNHAAIFTGYIALLILFWGLARQEQISKHRRTLLITTTLLLIIIVISSKFPGGFIMHDIYFRLFSMFRAVSRLNILAALFIGLSVSIILSNLVHRKKLIIVIALSCLVLIENMNIGPANTKYTNIEKTINLYEELQKTTDIDVVASYPLRISGNNEGQPRNSELIAQIVHNKTLVGGTSSLTTESKELRETLLDINDPNTVNLLKSIGVDAIIINHGYIDNWWNIVKQLKSDTRVSFVGEYSEGDKGDDKRISLFKINDTNKSIGSRDTRFTLTSIMPQIINPYKYQVSRKDYERKSVSDIAILQPQSKKWRLYRTPNGIWKSFENIYFLVTPSLDNTKIKYDQYTNYWVDVPQGDYTVIYYPHVLQEISSCIFIGTYIIIVVSIIFATIRLAYIKKGKPHYDSKPN